MLTAIDLLRVPTPLDPASVVVCCVHMGEPVGKARPRVARGRAYTPEKTRKHEASLRNLLWGEGGCRKPDGVSRFGVRMRFYRGDRRRVDVDNAIKCILDAAQGAVFDNDAQVVEVYARIERGCETPRTEVVVYRLDNLE